MRSFSRSLIYLSIFVVIALAAGIFTLNAINRPIDESTTTYRAQFTNAAGLRPGNDVRMLGVEVGKVSSVNWKQHDNGTISLAEVKFTLVNNQHIYDDTKLVIRYLNLTGVRYIDVQQAANGGPIIKSRNTITVKHTVPSFDVSRIFRGLAPAFAVMKPDDVNRFASTMLALVEGDGSGFGEILQSLTRVLRLVDDRSVVVNQLVDNLKQLSGSIGNRTSYVAPLIDALGRIVDNITGVTDQWRTLGTETVPLVTEIDNLFQALGLGEGNPDIDHVAKQVVPVARSIIDVIGLTPGLLQIINDALPSGPVASKTCSKGQATLPREVGIYLQGSAVTLCNR